VAGLPKKRVEDDAETNTRAVANATADFLEGGTGKTGVKARRWTPSQPADNESDAAELYGNGSKNYRGAGKGLPPTREKPIGERVAPAGSIEEKAVNAAEEKKKLGPTKEQLKRVGR
jgi:hypothetical protein